MKAAFLTILFSFPIVFAWPDVEVEKREYKTMLSASDFNGNSPCSGSPSVLASIESELTSLAISAGASASGAFSLRSGMPRTVKFYDTPGECRLNENSYVFRMRRKTGETNWEGTLKSRSGDRYHTTYRRPDINSCCSSCSDLGGKMEEDLSLLWTSKFSYSHKCEISNSRNINKLDDITYHWDQVDASFVDDLGWDEDTAIAQVAGLTVTECVYEGFEIDFDNGDDDEIGEFAVTLWYSSSSASNPALAELSFTIASTGGTLEDWNKQTIMTAHSFWDAMSGFSRVDPNSSTKTAWVYNYDSTWCS